MTNSPKTGGKQLPPYVPFSTFTGFLETLKNTTVPPRIDHTVTPKMSGQSRGALNSALRFLGLIQGDENAVTPALKVLVEAYDGPEWKAELGQMIGKTYRPIIADLDCDHATGGQLNEHFRDRGGVDGQVLEKCVRFFLSALDEAGTSYSPLFKTRGARTVRKRATIIRSKTKKRDSEEWDDENEIKVPDGTFKVPLSVIGLVGSVDLPEDVTQEQWESISGYVKTVIGYRQQAQKPKVSA